MSLSTGTRLGPYEILGPIGAGGMGEVYRAHDTKLKRDVALKVLPEVFAGDSKRMARFTREAQVLASLNHPNIAAIYGVEQGAIVMELVDVRPFVGGSSGLTDPGWKLQISTGGGLHPVWSRDGRRLFYQTPDWHVMVADCTPAGGSFKAGKPRLWVDKQLLKTGISNNFDVAPGGERLVVLPAANPPTPPTGNLHVTVLLNFFDELRRRLPAGGK